MFKRDKRWILLLLMVLFTVIFSGCQKPDMTPAIILEGDAIVEITLGDSYTEPGYQAVDYSGNDITADVQVSEPKLNLVGDQLITYTVTSNEITTVESRTLKIKHKVPDLDNWTHYNKGIPILMYHYVYDLENPPANLNNNYISTTDLESHLQYLTEEGYYFPTWQEVRDYVDCKIDLPEKSIVLTFDDGSKHFIEYGIPLLEQYDVKATAFVIASKNGEEMAAMDLHNVQLQSHSYNMHRGGGSIGHGGIFTALYYEDALTDLKQSIAILGRGEAFAYPFGDYTDYCMQTVADAGFLCAVTTEYGKAYPGDNPYNLHRLRVSLGVDLPAFQDLIQ